MPPADTVRVSLLPQFIVFIFFYNFSRVFPLTPQMPV
jgi:hypothetical protein